MAKDREDRKKEKREKKEKKERKERKRREAEEELAVRNKKISKKHHKSKSKELATEKPEKKPKKKSKKLQPAEEKPHKKKSKKHKKPSESEPESESEDDPVTLTVPSDVKLPTNESDSDSDFDKEDLKHLLETYTKEELVSLIHRTAEKGSRLISAVLESAELDSSKRNIFVRGLGWDTTHETLKSAFEAYGEIEECSVVMDKDTGRAKGYGFVMFKTRKGCRESLRNPEKRMFNRTVTCNLAAAKPAGAGKPREPVESVKIDLSQTQSEVVLPQGMDLGYGLDKGHKQQNVPTIYGGQNMNMPFYGHGHAPPGGYNPMYAAFMGNQMGPGGLPNFPMFGPGMMNHGPPSHMGMAGQFGGEGNGIGPGFDGERAWYLR